MDLSGIAVPTFDWNAPDLPSTFRQFRQYVEHVFKGPLVNKPKEVQASYLHLWMGPTGIDLIHTFSLPEAKLKDPKEILDRFDEHFKPKTNFRLARYNLQKMHQGPTESVDDFVARLRLQSDKCKFTSEERPQRILEQLIFGAAHAKIQEKLLTKGEELTLDEAINLYRTFEANQQHMEQFREPSDGQIHAIRHSRGARPKEVRCRYCDRTHEMSRNACPALHSECGKCGKVGHWAAACLTPAPISDKDEWQMKESNQGTSYRPQYKGRFDKRRPRQGRIAEMSSREQEHEHEEQVEDNTRDEGEHLFFDTLCTKPSRTEAYVDLNVQISGLPGEHTLHAKVDTGADGNILPARCLDKMPSSVKLDPDNTIIKAYNGSSIKQMGTLLMQCKFEGTTHELKFHVVESSGPILVGLPACEKLKLTTMHPKVHTVTSSETASSQIHLINTTEQLISEYPAQFKGIGKLPGKAHFDLDPTVTPVIHPPRKCPIHLKDDLKKELDAMEQLEVIEPVTEATDWVSSLVVTKKPNGQLRVCLDPKDLNRAIKRPHHRSITTEEITHQLSGSTIFTKLDARSGYWAMELDAESSQLTAFNSPFGRYRFRRLPFGIRLAQDLFQKKMDEVLDGLSGVLNIADDICVHGKNAAEHTERLRAVMKRAQEKGLVFNPDKCAIGLSQVSFFGHVYSASGVSPDPAKVDAIRKIERPKTVAELQSFLGMCTYLSPFIPGFSELTHNLRQMLKENAIMEWSPQACKDFQNLKDIISSDAVLAYYDPAKPATLEVDASSVALGAVLLQEGRPVAYASKALSDTETRYANIEREMLAVVFGCEKFRTYLFGRTFEVISDHKPLEMILQKSISRAPARLQRMLLRIENYVFTLKYAKGSSMHISDALSRLPAQRPDPVSSIPLDCTICLVQFSRPRLDELRKTTLEDEELCELRRIILAGWPSRPCEVPPAVRKYWSVRDTMVIDDGLILKGTAVVIPEKLRPWYMEKLHEGHQGRTKMELRARDAVFWPKIKFDIEERVAACMPCQTSRPASSQSSLIPEHQHPVPPGPWQEVSSDLFFCKGQNYLLTVDHFSKFPFLQLLDQTTSSRVIETLAVLFAEHGSPVVFYSDNGPQYSSREFKAFAERFGFEHRTSSPLHPRSNGIAERHVRTVKALVEKSSNFISLQIGLRTLRSTPIDSALPSPAELLYGRNTDDLPRQGRSATSGHRERLQRRQDQQREYHNARIFRPRAEPALNPGDAVFIRNKEQGTWQPGTVVTPHPAPASYVVQPEAAGSGPAVEHQNDDATETTPPPVLVDEGRPVRRTSQDLRPRLQVTRSGRVSRAPARMDL